jgi:hypothetical protein
MSLWSGQGPVFHADRNASGSPVNPQWFGNAPEFTVGLAADTLSHKESYSGTRSTDARIIRELTATVSITTDDFKESNMELATFGVGSQLAGSAKTAQAVWASAPVVGELYQLPNTGRVSGVTVKSAGVAVNTAFYSVDASGVLSFSDVTGVTGPITADFTDASSRQIGAFKVTAPEKYIILDGLNTAESTDANDYERTRVNLFKVRLDPTESLNFINDEFGTLVLNGSPLKDTLRSAASDAGQFMQIIYFDPVSQTVASASASPSASASRSVSPSASTSPSA